MQVCADANTVIDYIREYTLHYRGMDTTGRKADALRRCLGQVPSVLAAKTAVEEARNNFEKDLFQMLSRRKARRIKRKALRFLDDYCDAVECEDEPEYVPAAREMYAQIRGDPANQKFSKWRRKKHVRAGSPDLGCDANDLVILSTAVHYAKRSAAEFWTHDMDFTLFADEIYRTFGLIVVDTYRLGGRFL